MIENAFYNAKFDITNMRIKPYCEEWFEINKSNYKLETSLDSNNIVTLLNQLRIAEIYRSLEIDVIGENRDTTDLAINNANIIHRIAEGINAIKTSFFELLEKGIIKTVKIYYPFIRISTYQQNHLLIYTFFIEVHYLSGKKEFWIFEELPEKPTHSPIWSNELEEYLNYINDCLTDVRASIYTQTRYSRYDITYKAHDDDYYEDAILVATQNYILLLYIKFNFGLDLFDEKAEISLGFKGDQKNNFIKKDRGFQMSYEEDLLLISTNEDIDDYSGKIIEQLVSFETYLTCLKYFSKVIDKKHKNNSDNKRIEIYGLYLRNFIKKHSILCDCDLQELLKDIVRRRREAPIRFIARIAGAFTAGYNNNPN